MISNDKPKTRLVMININYDKHIAIGLLGPLV